MVYLPSVSSKQSPSLHPPLPLKGGGLACLPVGRGEGEALQNKAFVAIEYRIYPIYPLS
jgi:hypothetical protein